MGIVFDQVRFDGRAPELSEIASKVTELCGLPLIVEQSDANEKGNLYDQHGHFAFACVSQEQVEIHSYRPGAVRAFYDEFTDCVELPSEKFVTGLNEPAGTQAIYLTGFVGLETLMTVTLLALESLGGRPRGPISDETRREYGGSITEADLLKRRRQLHRQVRSAGLILLLMLPVTLPIFVLGLFMHLVTMPWRLRRAWKLTKDALGKRDHKQLLRSLPDDLEFMAADPDDYDWLDHETLRHYTRTLEALGFMHVVDYTVRYPGHALSSRPPGFARLWIHPVDRCFAEVNQAFAKKQAAAPLRCLVVSWLGDGWDLTTSDGEPRPISYAWRQARSLWSRHPQMSSAKLLVEQVRRRQCMMDGLGIVVITELTPAAYFDHARRNNADRKEVLRRKSIEIIRGEIQEFKRSPFFEWCGKLPWPRFS